jgi:tubulin--tyrosine ligase
MAEFSPILETGQKFSKIKDRLHILITDNTTSSEICRILSKSIHDDIPDCVVLTLSPGLVTALMDKNDAVISWNPVLLATSEENVLSELLKLLPSPQTPLLQISNGFLYSNLHVVRYPRTSLVYTYSEGSRLHDKDSLSRIIQIWSAKKRSSREPAFLEDHFPVSNTFQMPSCAGDPEFADLLREELHETIDTAADAYILNNALHKNQNLPPKKQEWWLLKPSLLDRGEGIRLFSDWDGLEAIFRDYGLLANTARFTAQRYIHPPLFLPGEKRKWHIRAYAIVTGMLEVYVFEEMKILFAFKDYQAPWDCQMSAAHLTNSSQLQCHDPQEHCKLLTEINVQWKEKVVDQICRITGEVFEAASAALALGSRSNSFQVFGLDFIVDEDQKAWLLEVNEGPDMGRNENIVTDLVGEAIQVAVRPFFDTKFQRDEKSLVRSRKVFSKRLWSHL